MLLSTHQAVFVKMACYAMQACDVDVIQLEECKYKFNKDIIEVICHPSSTVYIINVEDGSTELYQTCKQFIDAYDINF